MIRKLPKANQTLLRLLIFLLSHIRDHEASNRMSTEALGIVWGANLIQRPGTAPSPTDSKLACRIVECLLDPQMITNVLLESPAVVNELRRLFETKWDSLINTNVTSDEVSLTRSPPCIQQPLQDSYSTNSDLGRKFVVYLKNRSSD
ncbi:unnamed protein product [Echinostoma caproni]|uniref:Rho-GAP domain-containing protein n=1 Tax=Echinostoma caproni TaxID=27848 RepID=A0A183ABJ5_9TREM|nr:unnamed protein product [Echinostoma caproni]